MPKEIKSANVYEFLHGGEPYWGDAFRDLFDTAYSVAWNGTYASDQIFQGEEEVLSLWEKDQPLGLAIVCKDWEDSKPYLMMVFVKESERRKGIGTLLLDAVAKHVNCQVPDILGEATTQDGAAFASTKLPHIPISYEAGVDI